MIPLYTVKTKLIDPFNAGGDSSQLDEKINTFLSNIDGADVIDIKYQMVYTPPQQEHGWDSEQVCTALIIYKEWMDQ